MMCTDCAHAKRGGRQLGASASRAASAAWLGSGLGWVGLGLGLGIGLGLGLLECRLSRLARREVGEGHVRREDTWVRARVRIGLG